MKADLKRWAPTLIAGALAAAYVIMAPESGDLSAHLFRAKLFSIEGFGIWNNWWYAGHHTPGYSVLFPAVSDALSPQLAAAVATTVTAALFEPLARRHFGPEAWVGAAWFGAATAINLYTGRLAFAFGLMPAMATALALQRGRHGSACALAFLAALCSPVAALFAALAGGAYGLGAVLVRGRGSPRRVRAGAGVLLAALIPVAVLVTAFPEGGSEPFAFSAFWPIPVVAAVALLAPPRQDWTLRAGVALYTLGCIAAYLVPTAVGSNASRLMPLLAGPLAALMWWRKRIVWLAIAALPLLYLQWQAPVRELNGSSGDPTASAAYWRPLLSFLERQPGGPFRIEIPFTELHAEAYRVAPSVPLARGWERQLDIKYNHLFYGGALTQASYEAWLHRLAIRFVAVTDARLDYSAVAEQRLIERGLPYLRPVLRTAHFRVYAVANPTSLVSGVARLRSIGPDSLTMYASGPGTVLVRVRFTPYWALGEGAGCVAPDGDFTRLALRRAGVVRLVISFALDRIAASSPRCSAIG